MPKKFQIFVSSTYEDLRDAREVVIKAILEMGHIPVGMEMFSASDENQWRIIARTISDSDYYVLIVAHRYGSEIKQISYTEKEYDYAIAQGIPVISFVIDEKASWPANHIEKDTKKRARLDKFKEKLLKKPVGFWATPLDLYGKCPIALMKAFEIHPRAGWSKSDARETFGAAKRVLDISFEYSIDSTQVNYDNSYERIVSGRIIGTESMSEAGETELGIGHVKASYFRLGQAINDGISPWAAFDETQELMDLGFAIYDFKENDVKKEVKDVLGDDVYQSDILIIHQIYVAPLYRGRAVGYGALEDLIWNFGAGCGLIALYASPPQLFEISEDEKNKLRLKGFPENEGLARSKLTAYFEKFGFKRLNKKSDLMLSDTTHIKPDVFKLGYQSYIEI
jgi:Domain of unknown function (DUF4062)